MAGWSRMVLGNANAIDAVLKVKAIWIAVCLRNSKEAVKALKVISLV
jgi:hypothetical protein